MNRDQREKIKDAILTELHELVGICGHCGARACAGRKSQSFLPGSIPYESVIESIELGLRKSDCRIDEEVT